MVHLGFHQFLLPWANSFVLDVSTAAAVTEMVVKNSSVHFTPNKNTRFPTLFFFTNLFTMRLQPFQPLVLFLFLNCLLQGFQSARSYTKNKRKLKSSAFAYKFLNTLPGYLEYSEASIMVIDNGETVQ